MGSSSLYICVQFKLDLLPFSHEMVGFIRLSSYLLCPAKDGNVPLARMQEYVLERTAFQSVLYSIHC
jgi:hypothetical protein